MKHADTMESPLGTILLRSDGSSLTEIKIGWDRDTGLPAETVWSSDDPVLIEAKEQLSSYFSGSLKDFDLPLNPSGTDFQRRVWSELTKIPYGTTISYGTQARRVGNPNSSRAVGMANGRNPLPIVIPCHRVIGANGSLTGYTGGLHIKEFLLKLERPTLFDGLL